MPRLGRVVVFGLPHYVTQRGNRRQRGFFADGDFAFYRDILAERCRRATVAVWAYCLMPNHVRLIRVRRCAASAATRWLVVQSRIFQRARRQLLPDLQMELYESCFLAGFRPHYLSRALQW